VTLCARKAKISQRACIFEHYDKLFTIYRQNSIEVEFNFGVFWHRFIDQQVYPPACRGTKPNHSASVTLVFMWDWNP